MKNNESTNDQWVEFRLEDKPCTAFAPCPGMPWLRLELEATDFSELAGLLSMERLNSIFQVRPADLMRCFELGLADLVEEDREGHPGRRYRNFFGLPFWKPVAGEGAWIPAH